MQSRATIDVSAAPGRPGMPSRLDHSPFVHVPAAGERGVLGVLRDHRARERRARTRAPRRITAAVVDAAAVVGEDPHAERVQLPHRRELARPPGPS